MKLRLLTIATVLTLVGAACSTADSTSDEGVASLDATDTPTATVVEGQADSGLTEEEIALAFTQCLRDEGLTVDDPTVDSSGNVRPPRMREITEATEGVSLETIEEAREVCMPLLDGFTFGFESEDRTERDDQLLEFAACMRDNGYDMPDPDLSTSRGSGGGPFSGAIDVNDPDFQEAAAACEGIFDGSSSVPGTGSGGNG
ncbi:MAG: hypothetical protein M3094_00395 [Actinomycetia bacterium]|nr:hypothetical protein [Actinomycetes bacterium]